jgi:ubiquinone/menaquinone biosynthesis C-methylase UbiE
MLKKIKGFMVKNIWSWMFKTGMYDFLTMSSYRESLKKIGENANLTSKKNIVDAGCGSGLLLEHVGGKLLDTDSFWTGVEITASGVAATQKRITRMGIAEHSKVFQGDLTEELPLPKESQDVAVSHFCLYVLPEQDKRITALKNIAAVVKPGGNVFLALPSHNYNAEQLVKSSIEIDKNNNELSTLRRFLKKIIILTLLRWSEMSAAKEIQRGTWHGFTEEEIHKEVNAAGMEVEWIKETYGGTSFMIQCNR